MTAWQDERRWSFDCSGITGGARSERRHSRLAEEAEDAGDEADARRLHDDHMAANARGEWLSMPAAQWDRIRDGVSPVRVIREYRGLTQTRLARESGVDQSQISAIENSRRTGTAATLKAIAKALGAPLEVLIADDPPVSPDATRRP